MGRFEVLCSGSGLRPLRVLVTTGCIMSESNLTGADTGGHVASGVGLKPLDCRDGGFEFD